MSRISEATLNEIQARADAVAIVGEYVRLEKKSGRYWGLCPFHNEKTPSFTVNPDRKAYHCFGCGKGGGLINFVMEMDKLSFPEAVERLAKKLGVEVVYEGGGAPVRDDGAAQRKAQMLELYQRVSKSFSYFLGERPEGASVREYLGRRGVDAGMIERFELGYAPPSRRWLHRFLVKKGYSPDFLAESGLFSRNYPEISPFAGRLMFPIRNSRGEVIAFGGRLLEGEGPKYLNSPESSLFRKGENLFALDLALPELRKTKRAYLCEGYMDVIALHQAGIGTAVAPLGTAFTESQARLLRRWVERVVLVFDSDEAGLAAAAKGVLTCASAGLPCSVVTVAGGKDPSEILQDSGPEALHKAVECFINDFDYLVGRARSLYGSDDAGSVAKAVSSLFPYLEALDSEVSRSSCVGAIADAFGVEEAAVLRDFERRGAEAPRRGGSGDGAVPKTGRGPVRMSDELFVLTAAVFDRDAYRELRSRLALEDLEDRNARDLFVALEESYRSESASLDALLSRIDDAELRTFVSQRVVSEEFSINTDRLVSEGIDRVKRKSLERRRNAVVARLRAADRSGVAGADRDIEDLISEKMYIDSELGRMRDIQE